MERSAEFTRRSVRMRLAAAGRSLADVARRTDLDYPRVTRVLSGVAKPRPGELEAIEATVRSAVERDRA